MGQGRKHRRQKARDTAAIHGEVQSSAAVPPAQPSADELLAQLDAPSGPVPSRKPMLVGAGAGALAGAMFFGPPGALFGGILGALAGRKIGS